MFMHSVVMVALLATPAPPAPAPLTWKVTDSDVTFEMTAKDLRALRDGKEVFGLQALEKHFLSIYNPKPKKGEEPQDTSNWDADESDTLLSVVGTWVSYESSSSDDTGAAHPTEHTTYVTTDVVKGQGKFSLLAVFPEKEVLEALKADGFIKKHIEDAQAFKKARTVGALLETLGPGEDCVGFQYGLDAVEHAVAFHHLEGDKVAVRIAFGYESEACRGRKFVVGVLLPIPASLKPALERAARREEGFLMKDAKEVHAPSVHFKWPPPDKRR